MSTYTTSAPTAHTLEQQLRQQGYQPGAPAHLDSWAKRIDAGLCRKAICGTCAAQGLTYRPFHKGRSYRVLACCSRCGGAEEM